MKKKSTDVNQLKHCMYFTNEKIFSPFSIFIKNVNGKNDKEILELLELGEGKLLNPDKNIDITKLDDENCAYLFRDESWIHIMDDEYYSLWHSQNLLSRIEELGERLEMFTYSFGDTDNSFDFRYFKNGKKVREYIVDSPGWSGHQIMRVDFGQPLRGEAFILNNEEKFSKDDQIQNLLHIAESLGIQLPKSSEEIKCYSLYDFV